MSLKPDAPNPSAQLRRPTPAQRTADNARIAEGDRLMRDLAIEVPTSSLDATQKQLVWAHLKQHHPERVAFLQDDTLRAFMASTGAVPTFPRELVRDALTPPTKV